MDSRPSGVFPSEIQNPIAYLTLTAATGTLRLRRMAFPAASPLISSRFPVSTTKIRTCQLFNPPLINAWKQPLSVTCSAKFPIMENFQDPEKRPVYLNYAKEKLWKSVPDSVKQFPWKKAEDAALQELVVVGKETLKWSFLAWFPFSWLYDTLFSFSRNKELVIPIGLFVGILMTKYLDEVSRDFLLDYKDLDIHWGLVGISCFYILVKIVSTYLLGGNHFLLHVANGGLMQLLWNWKKLPEQDGEKSLPEDSSTPMNADN